MQRIVAMPIAILASVGLAACGNDAVSGVPGLDMPGVGSTTIDLNNATEYAAWEDPINAKCGSLETADERQDCSQGEMAGVTVKIRGPVTYVLAESLAGDALPEFTAITIGSDNPRLRRSSAALLGKEVLAPYEMDMLCPRSLTECNTLKVGDMVDIVGKFDVRPLPNVPDPGLGIFVESVKIQ